jgi:hypothetical protein
MYQNVIMKTILYIYIWIYISIFICVDTQYTINAVCICIYIYISMWKFHHGISYIMSVLIHSVIFVSLGKSLFFLHCKWRALCLTGFCFCCRSYCCCCCCSSSSSLLWNSTSTTASMFVLKTHLRAAVLNLHLFFTLLFKAWESSLYLSPVRTSLYYGFRQTWFCFLVNG